VISATRIEHIRVADDLFDRIDAHVQRPNLARQLAGNRRFASPGQATEDDQHSQRLLELKKGRAERQFGKEKKPRIKHRSNTDDEDMFDLPIRVLSVFNPWLNF